MGIDVSDVLIPKFDQLQIVKIGNGAVPQTSASTVGAGWGAGLVTNSYAHNLGFTPIVIGYFVGGTNAYYPLNYPGMNVNFGVNNFYSEAVRIYADSTNVYIENRVVTNTTGTGGITITTAPVKYFLLRSTAT